MRSLLTSVLVLGLFVGGAFQVSAAEIKDMGIVAGYRLNDGDTDAVGASVDGAGGFQVGGLAFLPLNEMFSLRTGFIYAQRNYEIKTVAGSSDAELAHFDIPITVMYKLGDMGGIFAGPGLALKISDDCDGKDCAGAKSTLIPISLGANFKVAPQFSAEIFYEMSGKVADDLKDARAVGVNAIVTFE